MQKGAQPKYFREPRFGHPYTGSFKKETTPSQVYNKVTSGFKITWCVSAIIKTLKVC